MRKRLIYVSGLVVGLAMLLLYSMGQDTEATLAEPVQLTEQQGDFILHMLIEESEEGIRILRSLEYEGEEPIILSHSSPLISISFNKDVHSFTGSPVEKEMKKGEIYHLPQPLTYKRLEKGTHQLFVKTSFIVNGKEIEIDCKRKLIFL